MSTLFHCFIVSLLTGCWSLSQLLLGKGGVHPGCRSVAGPQNYKHSNSHLGTTRNHKLTHEASFWNVGGSWSARRKATYGQGEQDNSTQKGPRRDLIQRILAMTLESQSLFHCAVVAANQLVSIMFQ